jgi:transcriptional regulator with XRE-family HTH domain
LSSKLGKLITEARLARSLSLRELARRIGKSPAYLVSLEQAGESPGASEDTLTALAVELELDRDVLLALAQKTPKDLVPRSPTQIALYRLIRDLPFGKQEELRRQLERAARLRKDR